MCEYCEPILIARKLDDDGLYVSIEQVNELKAKLKAENESLNAKLENVYDAVAFNSLDALKRERRLRRALYKACANWAKCEEQINNRDAYDASEYLPNWEDKFRKLEKRWGEMATKCLKKAELYK